MKRIARLFKVWRGRDRRREARLNTERLTVDSPALDVELVDASSRGLGIASDRPLRIGVIYPFRLRRDEQVSEIYGLVRWCDEASHDRFRAGVSVGKTVGPSLASLAS